MFSNLLGKKKNMNRELVVATTCFTEPEGHIIRARLESHGIFAVVFKDDLGGIYPNFQVTEGVRVMVRGDDLEQALEILSEEIEPEDDLH
jgi:hypothetical protein